MSLSSSTFERTLEVWDTPGREKTLVHTRPVGWRPFVALEPTDHRSDLLLPASALTGVIGMGVGVLVDALRHRERIVFVRPSKGSAKFAIRPLLERSGAGPG